jgi:hypothetical protein
MLIKSSRLHIEAYKSLKEKGIAGDYYLVPVYKKGLLFRKRCGQKLEGGVREINISGSLVQVASDDLLEIILKEHDFKYLARVKGINYDILSDFRLETKLQDEALIPKEFQEYPKRRKIETPELSQIKNLRVTFSNPEKRLLPINVNDLIVIP